jgi:hypothetical protein
MLPPEPRLPKARLLIGMGQYFVVHAPRQTGKTTSLLALAKSLTAEGEYAALHFSCEQAQVAGDDYGAAERLVLAAIRRETKRQEFPAELLPPDPWPQAGAGSALSSRPQYALEISPSIRWPSCTGRAHRGHRAAVYSRGGAAGVRGVPGSAVAGQRARLGDLH